MDIKERINAVRMILGKAAAEADPLLAELNPVRLAANRAYAHGMKASLTGEQAEEALAGLNYAAEDKQALREVLAAGPPLEIERAIGELQGTVRVLRRAAGS